LICVFKATRHPTFAKRRSKKKLDDNEQTKPTAMTLSPLKPLSEIQSVKLTRADLMIEQQEDLDEKFLEKFEAAWSSFLQDRPLKGKHEERILQLQNEAAVLKTSKDNVERELKKQTAFFRSSRKEMEALYRKRMQEAVTEQLTVHAAMQQKLDSLVATEQLLQQTLPWHHFVAELDRLVTEQQQEAGSGTVDSSVKVAKPTARSIFLAQTIAGTEDETPYRASSTDNVLLKTHVGMLEQEIECYEQLTALHQLAGEFLTDHNVWELLKPKPADFDASSCLPKTITAVEVQQQP
jgi:hypothetical protein